MFSRRLPVWLDASLFGAQHLRRGRVPFPLRAHDLAREH
jgi:hypothetical protein